MGCNGLAEKCNGFIGLVTRAVVRFQVVGMNSATSATNAPSIVTVTVSLLFYSIITLTFLFLNYEMADGHLH